MGMSETFLKEFERYAFEGFKELGIEISPKTWARLKRYFQTLKELGEPLGLTALKDPRDFAAKHLLDSLAVIPHLPPGPLLDLGTGAGLPGMVIKIVEPEREVWLVDARKKSISFLTYAAGLLSLKDLHLVQATVGQNDPLPRDYFSTVVSRAVAELKTLWEWARPLLRKDGVLLAMKGPKVLEEIKPLQKDQSLQIEITPLQVPLLHAERNLVKISRHENR